MNAQQMLFQYEILQPELRITKTFEDKQQIGD